MLIKLFYSSIFGYVIGNIRGFIKHIFSPETAVWQSPYWYKRRSRDTIVFALEFGMFATVFGLVAVFVVPDRVFNLFGLFFLMIGGLFTVGYIEWFDRLVIFHDRIEKRLFFHTIKIIPFSDVEIILRDTDSKQYADIIYRDSTEGLAYTYADHNFWKIPVTVFRKNHLAIDSKKLHKNLFQEYEVIKHFLPPRPIRKEQPNLGQYLMGYSALLINPVTVAIGFTLKFGFSATNPWMYIALELSRVYFTTLIYTFSKTWVLDLSKLTNKPRMRRKVFTP